MAYNTTRSRLLWFIGIWLASVATLLFVAYLIWLALYYHYEQKAGVGNARPPIRTTVTGHPDWMAR